MKILSSVFLFVPSLIFSQASITSFEFQMFNLDKVVVSLDGKQFSASRKFRINDIAAGDHQLKIYKPKKYLNPKNNSISERLIPVYSGSVFVADKSCTACTLNEYHDKVVVIN